MSQESQPWPEETTNSLVRPYAVTRGRVRSTRYELDLVTLVVALRTHVSLAGSEPEHEQILRLCQYPLSVAEVAAKASLPLAVVKVLLSDLIEYDYLIFRPPLSYSKKNDPGMLRAVLDGIRRI
jgi:hypothetical protein